MTGSAEHDWLLAANSGNVIAFFNEIGITLPDRPGAEAAVRCFANPAAHNRDDRSPSCSVNLISGVWHCKGCGEQGNAYRAAQLSGMQDRPAALLAQSYGLFLALERDEGPQVKLPGERQLKKWRHALRANPQILARLQELKGWAPESVTRLGIGWDGERLTFPIRNAKLKIAGVVRYVPGGSPKSKAVPGSRRDLFPAPELIRKHHPLFVVEGEGDVLAVWSLGLKAVGIPGAGSWRPEWASRLMGRRVVVLSDCDPQGRALAARVAGAVPSARVVDLEPGREDGCDVGDWVREAHHEGGIQQMRRVLERLV